MAKKTEVKKADVKIEVTEYTMKTKEGKIVIHVPTESIDADVESALKGVYRHA